MISQVVVAIPSYNEEAEVEGLVTRVRSEAPEVWIIDDGSSDRTAELAKRAGARVISHATNQGKGMAIRTALEEFKKTSQAYLIFMDGDGQHEPKFISDFVRCAVEGKADLVVGNRMLQTASMPRVRRSTNRFMSAVVSWLARCAIPDSQCGFRLVSRRFVSEFVPTTHRFDLESEMLIQAGRMGMSIQSVPISTIYGGRASHIHPVADTFRFVRLLSRYLRK